MSEIYSDRIDPRTIGKYYEVAARSVAEAKVKESEIPGDHTAKMRRLAEAKRHIDEANSNMSPQQRERHETNIRLATLLEDVITRHMMFDDWLEEGGLDADWVETQLASCYDDIINAADIVCNQGTHVFAIDVTYNHTENGVKSKMSRCCSPRDIPADESLPFFTRLDFSLAHGHEGVVDNVPRFVVGLEVDSEEFFKIVRADYASQNTHLNPDEVKRSAKAPSEKVQYKVVQELAAQASAMLAYIDDQISRDDGTNPRRTARLTACRGNLAPLVPYFKQAFDRVKLKYPHLKQSEMALEQADKVYKLVLDAAESITPSASIIQLRKVGSQALAHSA
jgi:hypothetical protein